jgi:hypothetical protein
MIAATLPRRATGEPDLIFAAIERHRAALRACTDAPEWIEPNEATIEATEELAKALEAVLSTPPTTIAGIADLLDYVAGENQYYESILENALEGYSIGGNDYVQAPGVEKAADNFLPMITATLRTLVLSS